MPALGDQVKEFHRRNRAHMGEIVNVVTETVSVSVSRGTMVGVLRGTRE